MHSELNGRNLVGYTTPWYEHELDARWSMAYAAALGDLRNAYFDNTHERALAVHPVFPVCLEWPALVASLSANGVDMHRTVHATHDLHLLRPLVPPLRLRTRGQIIGVEQRKPGVYLMWRFDTNDSDEATVCQTWQGNLFLGATLEGD
ncbi:MAG: MaoC family dehydratase N-terminal domain-containing protein, partial [Gammaproteobacteria bacterium]